VGSQDREWEWSECEELKEKGLDGNLENGGKWRLSRKDGFGQAPAKPMACDCHREEDNISSMGILVISKSELFE
jgi:hypothetical protein